MNENTSRGIELLRFPLIIGVVMIHSYTVVVTMSDSTLGGVGGSWSLFTQNLFSQVLGRVAVPLFFLMSGYLLYRGGLSKDLVRSKWRKRVTSLLVPFLFWNLVALTIQFTGQSLPGVSRFFSGNLWDISQMTWVDFFDAFIGFDNGPINFPLWFIRDLMVLVVFYPLIVLALKYTKGIAVLVPLGLWLGAGFTDLWISEEALFFFSLGLLLSGMNWEIPDLKQKSVLSLLLVYIALALYEAYLLSSGLNTFWWHKLNVMIGCVAWLLGVVKIRSGSKAYEALVVLAPVSFFVYVAHSSLLQALKKLTTVLLRPESDMMYIMVYFIPPVVAISLLVAVYFWFLPYLPGRLQRIMLGSKTPAPRR